MRISVAAVCDRRVRIGGHRPPLQPFAAFTLLELLVVIGLIAALSFVLFRGLAGGSKAAALQSAQATVSSLITAARTKAAASNHKVRLLVNVDPGAKERYLRCIVLQQAREAGSSPVQWDTVQTVNLPVGTYVVPASLAGLVADVSQWKRVSSPAADLVSDLFQNQNLSWAIEGDMTDQLWTGIAFTPHGTLAALGTGPPPKGFLVLSRGQARPPGAFAVGEPPVELTNAAMVRGMVLSAYGVPALLHDRSAF